MLSSNSTTLTMCLRQVLTAGLNLKPLVITCWAADILHAFEDLHGCAACTQAFLQGTPIYFPDHTANLRFWVRSGGNLLIWTLKLAITSLLLLILVCLSYPKSSG